MAHRRRRISANRRAWNNIKYQAKRDVRRIGRHFKRKVQKAWYDW